MTSIYDSEQYLFEIAQSFIRSRIIFTSIELKIFDILVLNSDGLTCSDIAQNLNLNFIKNQSRCLQDCLDCLTSMKFLEFNRETNLYKVTKLTRNYLLPNQILFSNIEKDFYTSMYQFYQINHCSQLSLQQLMIFRIKQLVNLSNYSNISIDTLNETNDVIIFWKEEYFFKEFIQQAYEILPINKKGLLILILPNNDNDEISLAMNICLNMTTKTNQSNENIKEICSKKFLKQIGFRSIEKVQTGDDLQLLLAFK